MSFDALFTSIYRLYYKGEDRQAFFDAPATATLAEDLSEEERALLSAIDQDRMATIIDLHGNDIWAGWYADRFGATWEALRTLLKLPDNAALVAMLTASPSFEIRVNDDRFGDALFGLIEECRASCALEGAAWLEELFEYELMLAADIGEEFMAGLGNFAHRVDQLTDRTRPWTGLPSTKRISKPFRVLVGISPEYGFSEIEITSELCIGVLSRMLSAGRPEEALIERAPAKEVTALEEECEELLGEMADG